MGRRREWAVDGSTAAVLVAPVVVNHVMSANPVGILGSLVAGGVIAATARRWPLVGWLVVVVGTLVDGNFVFALPVMSYLVGLRTERIRVVAAAFVVVAAAGTVLNFVVLGTSQAEWFSLTMMLVLLGVFPWLAGRYRAQQARLISAGWERAARLESERRMVRLRERARIAQEMHDSLGHELSLIALSAGALETTPGLAGKQSAAAGRIRESAATATDQLREIIGVLREDGEPAPTSRDDIAALIAKSRAAGMTILVETSGELPRSAERTAYEVVRESLTNASRHAPGATVRVTLTDDGEASTITVVNDAPERPAGRKTHGAERLGLVGLRERVRLNGGTLLAGPTPTGGFRTVAEVPRAGAPAHEEAGESEMRRRARRSLAAAVLTPAVLALVTALGYYPFAVAGSVLEEAAFERMSIGTPRGELAGVLPSREAPGDKQAGCELYSDGNFPMADAAYRLCFTDERLSSKERLK
ncbi:two-component sensor histidine kinase [Paractinoplanes abujensis]|uniref:histidine kinase n=1 Tax=Paractinoplanes abujensis TaxID=882441 RepID=A0A7W7CUI2_9ACTN|nr:histidine kinase [Actinoplanes abujensis]MBB4694684.1 signal transduction histidine kinase [Actinoplanes abujensis]GID20104.1 two-component sensor histidine kinase [Actinoplanes abujensis]